MKKLWLIVAVVVSFQAYAQEPALSDNKATRKTRNLYAFLASLSPDQVMFGHQDDFLYGLDWKYDLGSDVERVSGQRPAVVGWDIGKLGTEANIDSFRFDQIIKGIRFAYKRGAINTISWHMYHPMTNATSWDKQSYIKDILPGGKAHEAYLNRLDQLVDFVKKCKAGLFAKIPLILRPFHEHNGDWFWWGKSLNQENEYIALWRFTINYLRDEKKLHNLIYAFSPDRSRMQLTWEDYHYGYPGDDYLDIIGLDNYWDMGSRHNRQSPEKQLESFTSSIQLITQIAGKRNKIAALTETGNETVRVTNWYTERLLAPVKDKNIALAWVLVWRNANMGHFYVPYKGHHNEGDFRAFEGDQTTLFLKDIDNPYKKIK